MARDMIGIIITKTCCYKYLSMASMNHLSRVAEFVSWQVFCLNEISSGLIVTVSFFH